KEFTVAPLPVSVDLVLNNPSFREFAWNLKESFLKSGGYQEAADEIFTFIGQ
ncbi:macrolide family glycosyltransferase, partial [Bacillus cereus group sp. Bce025]